MDLKCSSLALPDLSDFWHFDIPLLSLGGGGGGGQFTRTQSYPGTRVSFWLKQRNLTEASKNVFHGFFAVGPVHKNVGLDNRRNLMFPDGKFT